MSTSTIKFTIATPERTVYSDDVERVTIPTKDGEITVLPHHAPLVSVVNPGELRVVKGDQTFPLYVAGGTLEIRPDNTMVLLASHSEEAHDIDVEAAEAAYERARKAMESADDVADVDFAQFQAIMNREMARIKVGRKWRK
jgi:F-type H+-transporting ATPase subunit epsilon